METDALTAHLDRGWDLLGRGQLTEARISANQILSIDEDAPEGHALLGAICAAEGEAEEALEHFQHAIDVEPDYIDAVLYAADLAIHPMQDFELALRFCGQADALAESAEERFDVDLLRAEALWGANRVAEARSVAQRLLPLPHGDSAHCVRVARLLIDVEFADEAIPLLRSAATSPEYAEDAQYYLGIAYEMLGNYQAALDSFVEARKAAAVVEHPDWLPNADALRRLLNKVAVQLGQPLAGLAEAAIHLSECPPIELIVEGLDPRALVFLSGAAAGSEAARLNVVFVYLGNLGRFARCEREARRELYRSLLLELAAFYQLDAELVESLVGRGCQGEDEDCADQ